ncbi:MAG: SigE family RNA polymerase sigma factor [Tetrasphaera sp.]
MSEVDYEPWVRARLPDLLRFAYLVTGNRESAQDAVQTALAGTFAAWPRLSREGDPAAYVRRAIVNAHVSGWRRFGKRQTPVAEVRADTVTPHHTAPGHAEHIAEHDAVWRMCAALPPKQRAAVVLRFYEDLDYAQIAALLGCPEATARSHIRRALIRLRTELTQDTP